MGVKLPGAGAEAALLHSPGWGDAAMKISLLVGVGAGVDVD
jgi:hypothetical protein